MNEVIKKNALNYGIIWGVVYILFVTTLYVLDPLFLIKPTKFISFILYIVLGIMIINKTKKELGGYISFKEAFTTYFLCSVIGLTISTLYDIILFNIIDPSIKEPINDYLVTKGVEGMKMFGAKTEDIKKFVEEIQNNDQFSPLNQLLGLIQAFLISAVFGSLLALIFRNKTSNLE
ncbi:hypothetical protein FSS13T_00860 [Flavobacterium saliperosum S13]|uniref:DUF4199 domain-containing protein n=2 Tax=Flavobacterium saliperosum TaxID=329186 RepID=A0A1G4V295_9FLAO|nr:DUF4199 domain-containing protein [Flavobacterium saliperosum]ESU28624.1 hypothetical protein FSS13T_00860 [Flavobacterium saliperosum S13]SCX00071.1 Protein of unknown function [Flavobacterium saliperosum]